MKPARRKLSRKDRSLIMGLLIAVASLFVVIYLFEVPRGQVLDVLLGTLLFLLAIILLAVAAILAFKLLGRLLRKFR